MMGGCFSTSRTDGTEDSYHVSLRSLMAAKQTPLPSHNMAKKIIERKLGLNTRKTLQARTNLLDIAYHNLAKAKQRSLVSFPPSYYLKSDTTLFPLPLPPGYNPSTNNRNTTKSSSLSKSSSISKSTSNSIKSKRIDVNSTANSVKSKRIDVNSSNSTANFPTSNTIDVNSTTSSFGSNSPRSPCHSQSNSTTTCNSSCEALTPSSSTSSSVFSAAPSSLISSSFSSSSTNSSDRRCNSLAHSFENESSFFTPLPLPSSAHKVQQAVDFPLKEFSALEIARACDDFDDTYKLRDGSMGPFYKVYLPEEQSIVDIAKVATKLSRKKWKAQIQMLASQEHPNLCKVIGFSYERAKCNMKMNGIEGVSVLNTGLIVYESIGNESLEEFVQDVEKGRSHIDWSTRLKLAIGVVEGLSFLLQKMPSHVSYGDLTMNNIIIDFSLNVKLFDFVLSSTIDKKKEKNMVQALGNVLLKLFDFIRYPQEGESQGLKERYEMEKAYPPRDAKLVIQLAASCLLVEDSLRPSIQHVASVLRNIPPTQHVAKFFIKGSKSFTPRKKKSLSFG